MTRVSPQNLEAEQAVLGAILIRPNAFIDIEDILTSEMFFPRKHADIFSAISELKQAGEPVDILTVANKLSTKKLLDAVGGVVYLTEIIERVPTTVNIAYYANIVRDKSILRNVIDTATEIATEAYNEEQTVDDVVNMAEKKILNLSGVTKSSTYVTFKQTLTDTWEQIERLHEATDDIRGVPTGFKNMDDMLAGLQPSDLIILAARPSVGKTSFALNIVEHAAVLKNIPCIVFSLEMSANQLAQRMLASHSGVDSWSIRTGKKLDSSSFEKLHDAIGRLEKAPLFIDDKAGNSISTMRSLARRIKAEHGLGLIVVDYLQLMSTSKNYDSMVNQVTEISRSLKSLARELNVPVLALSQLSRAVESRGGKPRLSDLRDSGSIEQDADVVMFIHREDRYREKEERNNMAEILIEKHRNGPVGSVELYFDEKTTRFMNIDKNTAGYEQMYKGSQSYAQGGINKNKSLDAF
jgi:replicative DNA helicase